MADWYIRLKADLTPMRHEAAIDLPHDNAGNPLFLTQPRGNKQWYKEAVEVRAPVGPDERATGPFYENIDQPVATIRYGVESKPLPPLPPPALEDGNGNPSRTEINSLKGWLREQYGYR